MRDRWQNRLLLLPEWSLTLQSGGHLSVSQKPTIMSIVSDVLIRPISSDDSLEELTFLLHRAYADLGNRGLNYTAVDQSLAVTAERIAEGQCFVAVGPSALLGTIVVNPPDPESTCEYFRRPEVASAHQFAVAPELQGKGLGTRLLECAESWARNLYYAAIAIDTAEPAEHLIWFYAQRGYRNVDWVQWGGKRYRSVVMSKDLNAA